MLHNICTLYVILQTTNHFIVFMFMFMKGENKRFDKVLGASQFTDPTLEFSWTFNVNVLHGQIYNEFPISYYINK